MPAAGGGGAESHRVDDVLGDFKDVCGAHLGVGDDAAAARHVDPGERPEEAKHAAVREEGLRAGAGLVRVRGVALERAARRDGRGREAGDDDTDE